MPKRSGFIVFWTAAFISGALFVVALFQPSIYSFDTQFRTDGYRKITTFKTETEIALEAISCHSFSLVSGEEIVTAIDETSHMPLSWNCEEYFRIGPGTKLKSGEWTVHPYTLVKFEFTSSLPTQIVFGPDYNQRDSVLSVGTVLYFALMLIAIFT